MFNKKQWSFVFVWLMLTTSAISQKSHEIIVLPESEASHFIYQVTAEGDTTRFFGLGIYIDLLHPKYFQAYDFRHNRIPDDQLFHSLTSAYNLIYARFTYTGPMVRRPAFYDTLIRDNAFIMGAGHLPWYLRSTYSTSGVELLNREDQASLASRINREAFGKTFQEIVDFAGESNLIINLLDEPERGGYGGSWFYSRETLQLMYELASKHGLVSLGLGPVGSAEGRGTGNKLTWSIENPNSWFRNPSERMIRRTSSNWKQILDKMLTYYEGTYDIIYLNSYAFQIAEPSRTGSIVREMLRHPTINASKPVLPWISTENFRYGNVDIAVSNIRRQTFSAIANEAAGIMFYPDTRVDGTSKNDEQLWEASFDLVKELNFFRPVLERGKMLGNSANGNQEWILFEYKENEFLFFVNHRDAAVSLSEPGTLTAGRLESGVWYRTLGEHAFKRFQYPTNATFFRDELLLDGITDTSRIKIDTRMAKIGAQSLKMESHTVNNIEASKRLDIIPGLNYEITVWTYGCELSDPYLRIAIYSGDAFLTQIESKSIKDENDGCPIGWNKLNVVTDKLSRDATHLDFFFGVRPSKEKSTTWFDDINVRF